MKRNERADVPEINDDHTHIVLPASILQDSELIISNNTWI